MFLKQMIIQGKANFFKLGNYRFDAGPPLFTMPEYVDELFHLFSEDPRDFLITKKKKLFVNIFGKTERNLLHMQIKINFLVRYTQSLV